MAQGVLLFITIAGGGLALIHFSTLIAAFIGESVGMYESMASMKSLGAGLGIGAMAGKMTMKALGFVSKNKGKAVRGSKSFAGTPGFDMNQMNMSQAVNGPATMSSNNMMSNLMTNQFQKMNFGQKIADGKFGQLTRRGGVMGAVGLGTVGLTVGLAKGIANWKQGGFKGFRRGVEREASVTAKQNQNDLLRNKGKELVKQRDSLLQKTDSITNANSKQFSKTHKKVDKLNTKISKHNEYTTKRSDIELIRNTNKAIKQDIKANKASKLVFGEAPHKRMGMTRKQYDQYCAMRKEQSKAIEDEKTTQSILEYIEVVGYKSCCQIDELIAPKTLNIMSRNLKVDDLYLSVNGILDYPLNLVKASQNARANLYGIKDDISRTEIEYEIESYQNLIDSLYGNAETLKGVEILAISYADNLKDLGLIKNQLSRSLKTIDIKDNPLMYRQKDALIDI
ncbi:hypothetical protein GQX74_012645 [Glossina fuscipes]|nr:hypothetical protein GQX74_012645 [Glossina fuscipes]